MKSVASREGEPSTLKAWSAGSDGEEQLAADG